MPQDDGVPSPAAIQRSSIAPETFRRVLGRFPTGVVGVTGVNEGRPLGITIGSFMSLSMDPPLVAFGVDRNSATWRLLEKSGAFCVNVFSDAQEDVCKAFARRSDDRFKNVDWVPSRRGTPVIDGILAWIDCDLYDVHEVGDHYLIVGVVRDLDVHDHDIGPLLFFRSGFGSFTTPTLRPSAQR